MTADELCDALGIRRSTLSNYVKQDIPRDTSVRPHQYDLDECRTWIAANVRPRGGDQYDPDGDDPSDLDASAAQDLYRKERALKTAAERELRELKLAEERGELVRSADVAAEWNRAALRIRTVVMEIADQVMPTVQAAQTPLEVEEAIREGCRKALEILSDG